MLLYFAAICFATLSYWLIKRWIKNHSLRPSVLFWVGMVIVFLVSFFTFAWMSYRSNSVDLIKVISLYALSLSFFCLTSHRLLFDKS